MIRFLSPRVWRRLERRAVRDHERYLEQHLIELAEKRTTVMGPVASPAGNVIQLQVSDHLLVLGGVSAGTVARVLGRVASGQPLHLVRSGRYGPHWWIAIGSAVGSGSVGSVGSAVEGTAVEGAVGAAVEEVVLGRRLQIIHDRGPHLPSEITSPSDREALPQLTLT